MKTVFVSFYPGSSEAGPELIAALRAAGCVVGHSPNPFPSHEDWYRAGLPKTLDATDVFVAVACRAWDSSTWMAIEADEASRRKRTGQIKRCFFFNPLGLKITAAGMQSYMTGALPPTVTDAVKMIVEAMETPN